MYNIYSQILEFHILVWEKSNDIKNFIGRYDNNWCLYVLVNIRFSWIFSSNEVIYAQTIKNIERI